MGPTAKRLKERSGPIYTRDGDKMECELLENVQKTIDYIDALPALFSERTIPRETLLAILGTIKNLLTGE